MEGPEEMRLPSVLLTELFVTDMDGQLRESGVGDLVVGKHIGRLMSVLGGRLGAYRAALAGQEDLGAALERNLTLAPGADLAALADRARGWPIIWPLLTTRPFWKERSANEQHARIQPHHRYPPS
jgi:cytochrome b pre-mRNA-processing protein 3